MDANKEAADKLLAGADKIAADAKEKGVVKDDKVADDKGGEPIKNWEEVKKIIQERDEFKAKFKSLDQSMSVLMAEKAARDAALKAEQDKAELQKLESAGEYQKALAKTTQEWETRHKGYQEKVASTLLPNAIKAAASSIPNIDPDAIDDLPDLIGKRVKLDPETLQPMVMDAESKQLKDAQLKPITLTEYVHEFVKSRPRMLVDATARGSGVKAGSGKGGSTPLTLDGVLGDSTALKAMTQAEVEELIKNEVFNPAAQKARHAKKMADHKAQNSSMKY